MARIRSFLAVELSRAVRHLAKMALRELARSTEAVRWVEPENLHITVKFLGDVEDTLTYDVCRRAALAAAKVAPFTVECRRMGAFPRLERPRTLWLGVDDPEARFSRLQQFVEAEMVDLGFPADYRSFVPHVTVGRLRPGRQRTDTLQSVMAACETRSFGPLEVSELVVFSSELAPDGPVYTVLGRCPLGASP